MSSSPEQLEFFSRYKKVSQWDTEEVVAWMKGTFTNRMYYSINLLIVYSKSH